MQTKTKIVLGSFLFLILLLINGYVFGVEKNIFGAHRVFVFFVAEIIEIVILIFTAFLLFSTEKSHSRNTEKEKNKTDSLAKDLAKFKLAVDNVSEMVVITDKEGILIYGNKAVKKITGYDLEQAMGKKAGTLWSFPMSKEYYAEMWRVIKTEKQTFHGELQNRRKNGVTYEANISISPVLDNQKNILFFVGIERDISKEKEIDRAKTEFVSLASHQLRTPLSSINWYAEMLLGEEVGGFNEAQHNYLKEIYASSQRMSELVSSFLDVSRSELGTFTVETSLIDAISLAKNVLHEMKPDIVKKQITIKESFSENLSLFQADQKLLRMVFQNLLTNAVKYSDPGEEVKFEIRAISEREEFGGKKVGEKSLFIRVSDFGIGIPEQQQDKIFTKLFRADNASSSRTEGTGLGLYIVKAIVEQSSGQIWFTSKENIGTDFYVSFPLSGMKKKESIKKLD